MNLLVLHILCLLERGGAERRVYKQVREQRRPGRKSDILVANEA
jgi:hypothetical protein